MMSGTNLAPITVVITTYNDQEFLEQAIVSVLEQRLLPKQIIVIDDGSSELTAQTITEKFKENTQKIEVFFLRKENGGASSARNHGIMHATQKYIAFLDVDDKMLPNNLYDKYELIKDLNNEYFGVYGGAVTSTGLNQTFANIDGRVNATLVDKQVEGIPGGSPYYLFDREALVKVGGFDEDLRCNEDYDILIRLIIDNKKCKGSTAAGFYRNLRPDSLSRPKDPMKSFLCAMQFLKKAERLGYYDNELLNHKKFLIHLRAVGNMILNRQILKACIYARKGFKYGKPETAKQKLLYFVTLSFI